MGNRERLGSRLGFIMLSAGCAIGCGNVWKFPWMCGSNGGGSFMLLYILCLLVLGLPAMVMELAVGLGGMAIFGSYIGKDRRLTGEAVRVGVLDTLVALMAGLVIFPSCFAFGVEPASGPSLVFITLPIVFNAMPLGQLWGTLFFLFMSFAALSTVIAVFETIMAFSMDQWGVRREKACLVNGALIALLSIPCVLGFNVLSGVAIPGIGDIQSIEDFLVSNNILPLGGLFLVMFVTSKRGWGWKNFLAEADTGEGLRFPAWSYRYMKYVLPVGIVIIFVLGYAPIVSTWLGVS